MHGKKLPKYGIYSIEIIHFSSRSKVISRGDNEFVDNELLTFSWKLDLLYHIEKEKQGLLNVDRMK